MKDNNIEGRNAEWRENLRRSMTAKERMKIPRVKMPVLKPEYRIKCNDEVNMGITAEMAVLEAKRCLDCPNPQCVTGCPVSINIPQFIKNIERGNFAEAAATLKETSALPAVCGRVCPQEKQCESKFGYKYEEMFVDDVLKFCGLSSELCDVRYPYDVLVDEGVKVDVKASRKYNAGTWSMYTFNLEKGLQTCDVFVFYCINDEKVEKVYIVPSSILSGKTQFSIGILRSKYDQYLDRWDIISKYAELVRGCV